MPETPDQSPAPEDDLDRALRELTEGRVGQARFREPSATERSKAAARASKKAAKGAAARARAANRTTRRARRRSLRRRTAGRAVSAVIVIVIVAGVGLIAWQRLHGAGSSTAAGTATASPAPSPSATPPPSPSPSQAPGPPGDPFATTPADHWANGAAGVTVPAAKPAGSFTAAQVAASYQTTRAVLIAEDLDPQTLRGGAPAAYEKLLIPEQRSEFVKALDKTGLDKTGAALSSRGNVASFAPGSTQLVGSVIKVHGTMSAKAAIDQGRKVLEIEVNYRFVYVVEPPGKPQDWMRVVQITDGFVEFSHFQGTGTALQPWVETDGNTAGIDCGTTDGYIHPDFPAAAPSASSQPSGPAIDPYSSALPPDTPGCHRVTRT